MQPHLDLVEGVDGGVEVDDGGLVLTARCLHAAQHQVSEGQRQAMALVGDELPADLADELDSVFENFKVNAEKIHEHGQRAEGIVHNMLEHSKTGEGKRTPTDLNEFVDEYVTLARHSLSASEGDFEVKIERIAPLFGSVTRCDPPLGDINRAYWILRPMKFIPGLAEMYKADPPSVTEYKRLDLRRAAPGLLGPGARGGSCRGQTPGPHGL